MSRPLRIGIVVGEASGDILGAGLMQSIRRDFPGATFEGIGGPLMQAEGFVSFYPLDRLSVMGFVDPLKRLPELFRMRRNLVRDFIGDPPDLFIGIDSPDFNLGIELRLRRVGIKTVHYVSPSVWAWRQGRVKKIARAVDLMLTLFPFEAAFYEQHAVPVRFVGHPLADQLDLEPDVASARIKLGLKMSGPLIAVLPGSRSGEINMMGELFLRAMARIATAIPTSRFLIPAANPDRLAQLRALLDESEAVGSGLSERVQLLDGQSREAMAAADVVVMTSGTTTLEAMLLKKPMVVAYRLPPNTYRIVSRMVKTEFIALPNLLAGEALVPELIQDAATAESVSAAVLAWLQDDERCHQLIGRFTELHLELRRNASDSAAEAIAALLAGRA